MNNTYEYKFALEKCLNYYSNCKNYLLDCKIVHNRIYNFTEDINEAARWQKMLECYIEKELYGHICSNDIYINAPVAVFNNQEYPFILKDNDKNSIAYIDIAETDDYVLLRRLIVGEANRKAGIGTKILDCLFTYCCLVNKELRVNVYTSNAEKFYCKNNFKLGFKTYTKKL